MELFERIVNGWKNGSEYNSVLQNYTVKITKVTLDPQQATQFT